MKQAAPNIDQAEIGKFDQLASRWWDPDSEFKPLHDINPLRLDYINRRVALAERKVIDSRQPPARHRYGPHGRPRYRYRYG